MSLSISNLINYRTKLEGMKGKKEKKKSDPVLVTLLGFLSCHVAPTGCVCTEGKR